MQPENPNNSRSFRETFKRIWQSITRQPVTKLTALMLAVIFWILVLASDTSLTVERTLTNVPVAISGHDSLRTRGLIITDDLTATPLTTKMRVEVKLADYDRAKDYLIPRLELGSQITAAGPDQEVFFSGPATNLYGNVLSFDPASIRVNVETISRRRIQVVVENTGESEMPLWIAKCEADPSYVTVSGPKSLVDQVQRAVVKLPLNSLSTQRPVDAVSALLEIQDAANKVVSSPLLTVSIESVNIDTVRIDLVVYPFADIPVHSESAVIGVPAHGYRISDIQIIPDHVSIAASPDKLAEIESVFLQNPLDISDRTESISATLPIRSIADIQHISTNEVTVEVIIEPAEHVHMYNDLPIQVIGLDPTLVESLSHTKMDVILRGDYDKVQGLSREDLSLYVDATGLGEGVHMLDVQCLVNGTDSFEFEPELPRITLTLTSAGGDVG